MTRSAKRAFAVTTAILLAALLSPGAFAHSQGSRPPENEVSFTVGYFEPRGGSDLWRANDRDLTFAPEDFGDAIVGARIGSALTNHFVVDAGLAYYDARTRSEYRDFTDFFGSPIRQRERLRMLPVTLTFKVIPFGLTRDTGGRIVPNRVVPYFGAGGGALLWKYRERGNYVDPDTLLISRELFRSRGVAPEYHGVAGVDVTVNPHVAIFVEGRLSRAKDRLSSDFDRKERFSGDRDGFERLDLSGDSVSVGTRIRF